MHLKRLNASKHYPIKRKKAKFTIHADPGPHPKERSIPLQVALIDILKLAGKAMDARKIIINKKIMIDGKIRTNRKHPLGLMDVLHLVDLNKSYRMVPIKGTLTLVEIKDKSENLKLVKIRGKRYIKGGKVQLNFHDGRCITIERKEEKNYKVDDSLVITLPDQKIKDCISFKEGMTAIIYDGKHAGELGKIKKIEIVKSTHPNRAVIEVKDGRIETKKDYLFVVGHEKPVINIS